MKHILNLEDSNETLIPLFERIAEGNTILFLGAGASVGEKRYLSKEIIQYYEDYLQKEMYETDITRFVDILSADPGFDRDHFDQEVVKMLQKYSPSHGHRIVASIPWKEIITTNYDLLIEQAYDDIKRTSNHVYDLKLVRNIQDYSYQPSNSEIRYIKLNGCISDVSKFPLAFSTEEFLQLKSFYKNVLQDLKNLSNRISLISSGYSFRDLFGTQLLEKFDSYNFRNRKWIYNIDPFPNENALHYYTEKRICIIKCSFKEFFERYEQWQEKNLSAVVKRKRIIFTNGKDNHVTIPNKLALNLENVVKQLDSRNRDVYIKDSEYYRGEEPNFDVIKRGLDVVKKSQLEKVVNQIESVLDINHEPLIPIFFLKGDFGIGKSTFTFRLIRELSEAPEANIVAFEILDFLKLRSDYLSDLFSYCEGNKIILYCDEMEVESSFKALVELRQTLSIEQFNDFQVLFIVPIRENILAKHQLSRTIKRSFELDISSKLSHPECDELLEKLKKAGVINYRNANEKNKLLEKVNKQFHNDSFVTLLQLVTNGRHIHDLLSAYHELSKETQEAFLFTALIHQFKLMMPAAWLREIISMDWEEFISKVVRAEGMGLLIQETISSHGTEPDMYFRTKHSVIASELVRKILPSKDAQFKLLVQMFKSIIPGNRNSYLVNNLLKTLVKEDYYTRSKSNKLHDIAYGRLSDDPHFLLNYSINLQNRSDEASLKRALELLLYAESILERGRKDRFIHRRAVINFQLAKDSFQNGHHDYITNDYIDEAKELFKVKQLLDPFSSYSYVDYIRMLLWELENYNFTEAEFITQRIEIEELFDLALNAVTDDQNRILSLKADFAQHLQHSIKDADYEEYLEKLYKQHDLRPYACILKYNFAKDLNGHSISTEEQLVSLIDEMHYYTDNNEVVKFLVKHYGRSLHNPNHRIKFFDLCRDHPFLEKEIPLRYYYFNFIAESYNYKFHYGRDSLKKITGKYNGLNPEFHFIWRDGNGEETVFEGIIQKWHNTKYKAVKISSSQQFYKLIKGDYRHLEIGTSVEVKLHFYLYGLMAEIIETEK